MSTARELPTSSHDNVKDIHHTKAEDRESLTKLRTLVLGSDYEHALRKFVAEDETERVAKVLSEAIRERAKNDTSITTVLAPLLDAAIDESIKMYPNRIINVIFPVMGPAIRKAVAAALSEMVHSLNDILSQSLSLRAVSWRIQAWRAGKSYGEFVLLKTLKYRVDQVFLIHRKTGLLLHDVSPPMISKQDPELVSAMLTAINDFVADSFNRPDGVVIESVRLDEFTMYVISGPLAFLAAAIRGSPPPKVNEQLTDALEQIHGCYRQELENFSGDKDTMAMVEPILKKCLLQQVKREPGRRPWLVYALITLLIAATLIPLYGSIRKEQHREHILSFLSAQNGYLVVDQNAQGKQLNISLLRSESSPNPDSVLRQLDRSPWKININDRIVPMDEGEYLLPFLRFALSLGDQVMLQIKDSTLIVSGSLSAEQYQRIQHSDLLKSHFDKVDTSQATLLDEPSDRQRLIQQWLALVAKIQAVRINFETNSSIMLTDERIKFTDLVTHLSELRDTAKQISGLKYQIVVTGFADSSGSQSTNIEISQKRAKLVSELLKANGINEELVTFWGAGHLTQNIPDDQARVVSLQIFHSRLGDDNENSL